MIKVIMCECVCFLCSCNNVVVITILVVEVAGIILNDGSRSRNYFFGKFVIMTEI